MKRDGIFSHTTKPRYSMVCQKTPSSKIQTGNTEAWDFLPKSFFAVQELWKCKKKQEKKTIKMNKNFYKKQNKNKLVFI